MLQADRERKTKLLSQRLALARSGVQAYQRHDLGTAVKSFITYLRILEDAKGVDHGGLTPQHFDSSKDLSELVMISGVYWDLVKIYDGIKVDNQDFKVFMRKYIQFTKGMPFQAVCSETLRKFISSGKAKHLGEFKAAYKILEPSRCFVVTSLVDVIDPQALIDLRGFRDQVLVRSVTGRALTAWYYRKGPALATRVDQLPEGLRRALAVGLTLLGAGLRFAYRIRVPIRLGRKAN